MKVVGIIAEYNPFHNGHFHHLTESVRRSDADCVVCIMSGPFTQRGEPALWDKWTRAETALKSGVDLVLELPFVYACNHANHFATGAVDILDGLGCVTHLSFGSEGGDLSALLEASKSWIETEEEIYRKVRSQTKNGQSFPKARFDALTKLLGSEKAEIFREPNHILAIEYLRRLMELESTIVPITVKRLGVGYHDLHTVSYHVEEIQLASATGIRNRMTRSEDVSTVVPEATKTILLQHAGRADITLDDLYPLIQYQIHQMSPEELRDIYSVTEGLEYRILQASIRSASMDELINTIKSKRFTQTRIQRTLLHILLGLTRSKFEIVSSKGSQYARVLGFSEKGAYLLKQIRKSECNRIPVLTNINKQTLTTESAITSLKFDRKANDLYQFLSGHGYYENSDSVRKPITMT